MFVSSSANDAVFRAFCGEPSIIPPQQRNGSPGSNRSNSAVGVVPANVSTNKTISSPAVEQSNASSPGSFTVVGVSDPFIASVGTNHPLAISDDEIVDLHATGDARTEPHAVSVAEAASAAVLQKHSKHYKGHDGPAQHKSPPPFHTHGNDASPGTKRVVASGGELDLAALNIHLPHHAIIDPKAKVPLIPVSVTDGNLSIEDMLYAQRDVGVVESATYLQIMSWFAARNPTAFALLQNVNRPLLVDGRAFPPSSALDVVVEPDAPAPEASHVFVGQLPVFMTQEWLQMILEFLANLPGCISRVSVMPGGVGSNAPYGMVALSHESHFQTIKSLDGRAFFCRSRVFFTRHVERKAIFGKIVARIIGIDAERPSKFRDDHLARTCLVASMAFPPKRNSGITPTSGVSMSGEYGRVSGGANSGRRRSSHGGVSPSGPTPPPPPYVMLSPSPPLMGVYPYHHQQHQQHVTSPSQLYYLPGPSYVLVQQPPPAYGTSPPMAMAQPAMMLPPQHSSAQQPPAWMLPPPRP